MAEIVVGVDGSEHSVDALRWAAAEARLRGDTLKVVRQEIGSVLRSALLEGEFGDFGVRQLRR